MSKYNNPETVAIDTKTGKELSAWQLYKLKMIEKIEAMQKDEK